MAVEPESGPPAGGTPTARLVVIGGFLGAGKTTAILRLAARLTAGGRRVGVITNDQSADVIDTRRMADAGLAAAEVGGGCFCCRLSEFVRRAEEILAEHAPDLLFAEPVGSCTDLVATVLSPLRRRWRERIRIGPLTVIVDPLRLLTVLGGAGRTSLSEKVTYIYRLQQQEADVVALSRLDLIDRGRRDLALSIIAERFPGAGRLFFSSLSGEGMDALETHVLVSESSFRGLPEIDYERYGAGEAELAWVDLRVTLHADSPFGLDEAAMALATSLRDAFAASGIEVAHAKVRLESDRTAAVASLVSTRRPPDLASASRVSSRSGTLIVNARVQADPGLAGTLVRDQVERTARRSGWEVTVLGGEMFRPAAPVPEERIPPVAGAGGSAGGGAGDE